MTNAWLGARISTSSLKLSSDTWNNSDIIITGFLVDDDNDNTSETHYTKYNIIPIDLTTFVPYYTKKRSSDRYLKNKYQNSPSPVKWRRQTPYFFQHYSHGLV